MSLRNAKILVAAAALSAGAYAQTKDALYAQLNGLNQRASAAQAAGNTVLAEQLKAKMMAISAQLGGAMPSQQLTPAAGQATNMGTPQFAVEPANCFGSPSTTYPAVNGTTGPLPDLTTVSFTAIVGGVANVIWDVDLNVSITHTWNADLVITLISPLATTCDISSNNGGANDNVFNGTLFDDQSLNSVVSYAYVNGVAAPNLRPEQSMNTAFRGQNANGTWTLQIQDTAGADIGNLSAWSLTITDGVLTPPPPPTGFNLPVTFTDSPNMPLLDLTVNSDTQVVSGVGTSLWDVDVYTEITHTWNADLEIRVVSPAGTSVMLSDNRGGANDDVFNGTLFDESSTNPIATYVFTNGVAAPDLNPDGNLNNYYPCGEDPNGVWTLIIADQAGADVGNLARWDLVITTAQFGCNSNVVNYCTSSTTTNGCNPAMSASAANASIAAGPGSFVLNATSVEGSKTGLIFYGVTGQNGLPWATGSTSFLCVKSPTQRTTTQNSGGAPNSCAGLLSLDFFGFMSTHPTALGQPIAAGQQYNAQAWFRDPPAPKTTNLSDGIEFDLCP
jgi:subtilisin-like proprotein convertase family protein